MTQPQAIDCRYLLGAVLFACMIIGGGTVGGRLIEAILQIFIICASTYTLVRLRHSPASRPGLVLLLLVTCAGIAQVIPLPTGLFQGLRPETFLPYQPGSEAPQPLSTISLSTSRTMSALTSMLWGLLLFIAFSKLSKKDIEGILPFFLAGLILNIAFVFLQISNGNFAYLGYVLGHEINSGLFSNENHLSTLICCSIPMLFYIGFIRKRFLVMIPLILTLLLCLLAIGSRAGVLLGFAVLLMSLFLTAWRMRLGGVFALCLLGTVTVYGYGAFARISQETGGILERPEFFETVLRGIRDNWILGTGYGSFDLVYPHYERLEAVYSVYVNHAHNDVMEFMLEGGVVGAIILLLYFATFLFRLAQTGDKPLRLLSALSIGVVLVHSTVDYPLRTMAVAASFAFFNALFFLGPAPRSSPFAARGERAGDPGRPAKANQSEG
jgi:O-antigen ligase